MCIARRNRTSNNRTRFKQRARHWFNPSNRFGRAAARGRLFSRQNAVDARSETRAATISKTNNQRQMLSEAPLRPLCRTLALSLSRPIFQRCSLHSASIRLHGPEQQADVVLISDAIYRAYATWKSNSISSTADIARSHLRRSVPREFAIRPFVIYGKLNDRRLHRADKKREKYAMPLWVDIDLWGITTTWVRSPCLKRTLLLKLETRP